MTTLNVGPHREVGCSFMHRIEILQFGSGVVPGAGDNHRDHSGGGYDRGPEEAAEGPSSRLWLVENHGAW